MIPTGCTRKANLTTVMATRGVPLAEVPLEGMAAWLGEAETKSCVIIVTKPGIWLATVGTQRRRVGISALSIM